MERNPAITSHEAMVRGALAAPSLLVSLGVTEAFFHFHSFTLELMAFSALWGSLYGLQSLALSAFRKP